MAETTAETNRNVGIGLLVGGLLLAGLLVVLIVVGWTSTPRNLILSSPLHSASSWRSI